MKLTTSGAPTKITSQLRLKKSKVTTLLSVNCIPLKKIDYDDFLMNQLLMENNNNKHYQILIAENYLNQDNSLTLDAAA